MSKQQEFFTELFGEKPGKGLYLQLWTKADKRTHYFSSATEAAAFSAANSRDLYVAVSLAPKNYGRTKRAPAAESAGIAGLWADIDVNGGPEDKTGAAPNKDVAETLAFTVLEPTIVVDSGYGLQAWWLFEDGPWIFDGSEDRERAARMATGWIALLRRHASEAGFSIDATQDLARLLRVPGTVNCKGGLEAACELYYDGDDWEGPRHSFDTLAELTAAVSPPATAIRDALEGLVEEFEVRPSADPPYTRMEAALQNSPQFRKTWEHERRDSSATSWSLSEYDLSLASQASNLGWTDQEIADLLIAHRRKYGDIDKALRPDYLRSTIAKARREQKQTQQEQKVESHLENLAAMGEQATPDVDSVMAEFNGVISSPKFQVRELIQDGEDPKLTRYRLIIEPGGREVSVGDAATLFDADAFAKALMTQTRHVMPTVKRSDWRKALQALMNVCTLHIAPDDTPEGIVIEWLTRYLGERLLNDQTEAARRREPFEKDRHVYVYAASFGTFVNRALSRRVSDPDLKQMLKAAGFTTKVVAFETEDGRKTSRSYYHAPREVLE